MTSAVTKPARRAVVSEPAPEIDRSNDPGLTIRHHVPYDHETSIKRPCVWCGRPTYILAETPFAEIGFLPLMLTCGAHMRGVYRMLQEGTPLDDWEAQRIALFGRLAGMLKP